MPSIAEPRANTCYQPILAVFRILYLSTILFPINSFYFLLWYGSFDYVRLVQFTSRASEPQAAGLGYKLKHYFSSDFHVPYHVGILHVLHRLFCFYIYIYIYYTLYGNPSLRWVSLAEPFVWFLITLFPKNPPRFVVWWSCFSARR